MDVRLAEITHKALVRSKIELLVTEEHNAVRNYGVVHLLHLPVTERMGQIDAGNLGADVGARERHSDSIVAHDLIRRMQPVQSETDSSQHNVDTLIWIKPPEL